MEKVNITEVCVSPEYIKSRKDAIVIITQDGCPVCEKVIDEINKMEVEKDKLPEEIIHVTSDCPTSEKISQGVYPIVMRIVDVNGQKEAYQAVGEDIEGIKALFNKDFSEFNDEELANEISNLNEEELAEKIPDLMEKLELEKEETDGGEGEGESEQ